MEMLGEVVKDTSEPKTPSFPISEFPSIYIRGYMRKIGNENNERLATPVTVFSFSTDFFFFLSFAPVLLSFILLSIVYNYIYEED